MPSKKGRSRSRSKSRSRKSSMKKVVIKEVKRAPSRSRRGRRGGGRFGLNVIRRKAAPVAKAASYRQSGPMINKGKVFNIRHKEMIKVIVTLADSFWVPSRFQCQPGLSSTFPWLATVAMNFREYRFNNLVFTYEPSCPTNFTGGATMIPLYDPNQATPESSQAALDCKNAVNVPIYQRASTNFAGQKTQKNLLIRTNTLSVPTETPFYDSGAFVFALDTTTGAQTYGKLFVSYDIDLFIPVKLNGMLGGYGMSAAVPTPPGAFNAIYSTMDFTTTVDGKNQVWMPDSPYQNNFFALGQSQITPWFTSANTITFGQPGYYLYVFSGKHNNTNISNVASIGLTNITVIPYIDNPPTVVNGTIRTFAIICKVTVPNGLMQLNMTVASTLSELDCVVTTMPNQMWSSDADAEFGATRESGIPLVYSHSSMQAMLAVEPRSKWFQRDDVHVIPDDDFKSFLKDGKFDISRRRNAISLQKQIADLTQRMKEFTSGEVKYSAPPPFERKFSKQTLEVSDDDDFKVERPDTPLRVREEPMVPPISASAKAVVGVLAVAKKAVPPKSN